MCYYVLSNTRIKETAPRLGRDAGLLKAEAYITYMIYFFFSGRVSMKTCSFFRYMLMMPMTHTAMPMM